MTDNKKPKDKPVICAVHKADMRAQNLEGVILELTETKRAKDGTVEERQLKVPICVMCLLNLKGVIARAEQSGQMRWMIEHSDIKIPAQPKILTPAAAGKIIPGSFLTKKRLDEN
jgi:hypothetical protein